jgi:hypothetical protein
MNKLDCFSEKMSSRALGFVLLPIALFLAFIGGIILPVIGIFFALPLLILSGVLIFAPQSKACRLIVEKVTSK